MTKKAVRPVKLVISRSMTASGIRRSVGVTPAERGAVTRYLAQYNGDAWAAAKLSSRKRRK